VAELRRRDVAGPESSHYGYVAASPILTASMKTGNYKYKEDHECT